MAEAARRSGAPQAAGAGAPAVAVAGMHRAGGRTERASKAQLRSLGRLLRPLALRVLEEEDA